MSKVWILFLFAMVLTDSHVFGESLDHVLFDVRGRDVSEGWRLNIYGANEKGIKRGGSGRMESVGGRNAGETALRFSSEDAGSYNFVSPEIGDGPWREREYYGAEITWRGDGSAGRMQIYAVTPDGQYAITLRFDGTRSWQTEIHPSGWSRPGTPPLDWSKITRVYVNGQGTQSVDLEKITLVAGVKPIHLEAGTQEGPDPGLRSEKRIGISRAELFKLDEQTPRYHCRVLLEDKEAKLSNATVELLLAPPGEDRREVQKKEISLGRSVESDVSLPFECTQTRDGAHLFDVIVRDAKGGVAAAGQYRFLLMRPRKLDYEQVVLWPEPQIWKPGEERWILPETITIETRGEGDSFPSEHLAEKLASRYGIHVAKRHGKPTDVILEYVDHGVRPEGFVLDVGKSGARLQASSGRGMYYAVRTLLDMARQSSFAKLQAGILCTHCEDWPDIPTRVYLEVFISERYHRTPLTVEAFKEHIYDQVAGGRYNLYAMQISEHVRYDSHPELAPRNCFTKAELKEIIDFARRHYVDVAPGWNTPGHCGWLVQYAHQELREDGDSKTLCTSNPEGMRILKEIAGELLKLYEPKYFFMSGDEVNQGWEQIAERRCRLCAGKERNELLLEHWSELARFFSERGVRPILFDDMLSVRWNGGEPFRCAEILPKLPRNLIFATWGIPPLPVPPERLRALGFTSWSVQTAYPALKMDAVPALWRDYDALGIAETTTWVWSNFTHSAKQCNYSAPALHANASCCWNPAVASVAQADLIHSDGVHWSQVMQVPNWGARKISYLPIQIAPACNESTRDERAEDGKGWMDLGPERDLGSLPKGRVFLGGVPFDRPDEERDCILLKGNERSSPVRVNRQVLGLAFAHTAGADAEQTKALRDRFFRKNTDPLALPVACYDVRYADGSVHSIPVRLGYDVHFWDCEPGARVMPGPSTYWMGMTAAGARKDAARSDACVWVMEWKNPWPEVPVEDVVFVAAGTEAAVACLGVTAVER